MTYEEMVSDVVAALKDSKGNGHRRAFQLSGIYPVDAGRLLDDAIRAYKPEGVSRD